MPIFLVSFISANIGIGEIAITIQNRVLKASSNVPRDLSRGVGDINPNQTGRTGARHEGFRPAILGIKVLLITPEHFESGAGRLFPNELVILMTLPRR